MIIDNFYTSETNELITVNCDVFIKQKKKLFYSFPIQYKDYLKIDGSYIVASLYSACLRTNDEFIIKNSVSPLLISNISSIDQLFASWNWPSGKTIVYDKKVNPDPILGVSGKGVGCFFSGGVDSFYSLLKHKNSASKITHFIFVHGFDIDLADNDLYKKVLGSIEAIAKKESIELIPVKTNLREITDEYINWGHTFGGALASVALLLGNGLDRVYLPSSVSDDQLFAWGSDPRLDPLWSTKDVKIIHDGTEVTRLEKIANSISASPLALDYLRVCWQNYKGSYNCGLCTKCIRTMIELRSVGVLEDCKTFNVPLDFNRVRELKNLSSTERLFFSEVLEYLKRNNKDLELQNLLVEVLNVNRKEHASILGSIIDKVGELDRNYNKMRLYKFLVRNGIKKP